MFVESRVLTHGAGFVHERSVLPFGLDKLKFFAEEGVPFNKLLGIKIESITETSVVSRLPFRETFVGDVFRPAIREFVNYLIQQGVNETK